MSYYDRYLNINVLEGKVLTEVIRGHNEIIFKCKDGTSYKMYHEQDCCESVYIHDIVGDLNCLLNSPILVAEDVSDETDEPDSTKGIVDYDEEPYTWTFYKINTIVDNVTISWYGSSNGYYSEGVDFVEITKKH